MCCWWTGCMILWIWVFKYNKTVSYNLLAALQLVLIYNIDHSLGLKYVRWCIVQYAFNVLDYHQFLCYLHNRWFCRSQYWKIQHKHWTWRWQATKWRVPSTERVKNVIQCGAVITRSISWKFLTIVNPIDRPSGLQPLINILPQLLQWCV